MTKQDMRKGRNTGSPVSVFAQGNPFRFSLSDYFVPFTLYLREAQLLSGYSIRLHIFLRGRCERKSRQ